MSAIFEELNIERMSYADGALRLGVLYDLLGRFHHHDMRDSTVSQFRRRYQVEGDQVERVEATALSALTQLSEGAPSESDVQFLSWACRLHEIGISVAHNAYHKHGAYVLTYADMPGFSKKDQARLAMLVLGHRGKLEKLGAVPTDDSAWNLIDPSTRIVRTAEDKQLATRSGFGFKVLEVDFHPSIFEFQGVYDHFPVVFSGNMYERRVNRRLDKYFVPRVCETLNHECNTRNNAGQKSGFVCGYIPMVSFFQPRMNGVEPSFRNKGISKDFMLTALAYGIHNEIRSGKIHICHPHGQDVPGSEFFLD